MCAAGVFLLHFSGVAWLFPTGCAKTYLIILVSEAEVLGRRGSLVFKKS